MFGAAFANGSCRTVTIGGCACQEAGQRTDGDKPQAMFCCLHHSRDPGKSEKRLLAPIVANCGIIRGFRQF